MQLNALSLSNLRNLRSLDLAFNSNFNIFWGENGGGKTSLLEAIHLLTTGRSFRARQSRQLITFGEASCLISGIVAPRDPQNGLAIRLGIERQQAGGLKIRLGEEDCPSIALLAKTLPVQLINSDSYDILEAAPQYRRQFTDWLMFHVEHSFYPTWQRFKRALLQRNAALKGFRQSTDDNIHLWDKEFSETGQILNNLREEVLKDFIPIFTETLSTMLNLEKKVTVQYESGWDTKYSLEEALARSLERDKAWGYTTVGPQRADLEFLVGGVSVKNILSRGQLKLFIAALIMARAILLHQRQERRSVFLIDDLNSELDQEASRLLVQALGSLGSQVLITSVEGKPLSELLAGRDFTRYRVNRGKITREGN